MTDTAVSLLFVLLIVGTVALIGVGIAFAEGWRPLRDLRERQQRDRERQLPIWERLALAEERNAERWLLRGDATLAREHYRSAARIRNEASDALSRGQLPEL